MVLSLRFVKEIHARLSVRYGTAWSAKWAGLDMAAIEADWAVQLDGMPPASIRKALDSLPIDFPPTATAFRMLGVMRDESSGVPALPEPADPEIAKKVLQAMNIVGKPKPVEYMTRMWARKDSGEKLTAGQRGFLVSACRPGSDVRDGDRK